MPNSFDYEGHSPSNRTLFIVGLCFCVVAAASVVLAVAKSKGDLDSIVRVTAELVNVGDGLPEKSDVKFHGVLVGQVADVVTAPSGQANVVHINLKPEYASGIPATVTARVVPSNVFAVSSVQLVADGSDSGPPLQAGAVIHEDRTLATILFQTTLNKFRKVFAALSSQPTDRSVGVLEAVSEATHGKGPTLRSVGGQLNTIVAELNNVLADDGVNTSTVSALTNATTALRDVSPELFNALDDAVRPMRTLADKRTQLSSFLSAGLHTGGALGDAFDHQTDRLITITTEMTPVVGVLADNKDQFHPIANRIQNLAMRVLDVFDTDTNQFVVKAIISLTPTRTYVRADCPRYGALAGPSCQTAPETPTAPSLYPGLGSRGFPPPAGVTENRPNFAPPRDSTRHAGEVPGGVDDAPAPDGLPGPLPAEAPATPTAEPTASRESPSATAPSALTGGNIGPVGSAQEKAQLAMIVGHDATAATQLLLGPIVRGNTVQLLDNPTGAR